MIAPGAAFAQHLAILAAFERLFVWPCRHAVELREERRGDLRCACCDAPVRRRVQR